MKRFLVVTFFSPILLTAQKTLTISGKIAGLKELSPVSLIDVYNTGDTIAKGAVKKGEFVLKGTIKTPMMLALNVDKNKRAVFFLENSKVTITGDVNDLPNLKVQGSATEASFEVFQKKFNHLFEKINVVNQQMQTSGISDSLIGEMNNIKATMQKEIEEYVKTYKTSAVSSFLLLYTFDLTDNVFLSEKRFNSLAPSAVNNFFGDYLKKTINETKMFAIGSVASDFTQADTSGKPVSLSSLRGNYVLVDFWASWCGPCRQENPNVVYNFNKFKSKRFTVLGVSLDRPGQKDKWLQAIHADNLTWTHVSDLNFWSNAVAVQYKIQSIPQNFLIGPDGKIVAKNLRGPELESKLCELLGCN
jgi:peroxiredoxin